jgi:cytochrome c biogenesis protein ResB
MPTDEPCIGIWAAETQVYQSPWFYLGMAGLLVALVLGFGLMRVARRWLQSEEEELSPLEQLREFELLHLQGELSLEELERIRAKLVQPPQPEEKDTPPPEGMTG